LYIYSTHTINSLIRIKDKGTCYSSSFTSSVSSFVVPRNTRGNTTKNNTTDDGEQQSVVIRLFPFL